MDPALHHRGRHRRGALLLAGTLFSVGGLVSLGTNLTPLPYPKEGAVLVERGPYRLVRHPIYCGVGCLALGWALWVHGWLTLGYGLLLFLLLDRKADREERWLVE